MLVSVGPEARLFAGSKTTEEHHQVLTAVAGEQAAAKRKMRLAAELRRQPKSGAPRVMDSFIAKVENTAAGSGRCSVVSESERRETTNKSQAPRWPRQPSPAQPRITAMESDESAVIRPTQRRPRFNEYPTPQGSTAGDGTAGMRPFARPHRILRRSRPRWI